MGKVDVHFYKVWTGISSFYKVIIQIQILQRCYAALYFCLCSCRSSTAPAISSKWARKILNFCFILRKTFIEAVRGGGGPSHIQSDKLFIPHLHQLVIWIISDTQISQLSSLSINIFPSFAENCQILSSRDRERSVWPGRTSFKLRSETQQLFATSWQKYRGDQAKTEHLTMSSWKQPTWGRLKQFLPRSLADWSLIVVICNLSVEMFHLGEIIIIYLVINLDFLFNLSSNKLCDWLCRAVFKIY